jgi:hypothetical protein
MRYVLATVDNGHWFYNKGTRTGWGPDINDAKLFDTAQDADTERQLLPDEYTEVHILPDHTIVDHSPIKI